jgi:hypothetical protein
MMWEVKDGEGEVLAEFATEEEARSFIVRLTKWTAGIGKGSRLPRRP